MTLLGGVHSRVSVLQRSRCSLHRHKQTRSRNVCIAQASDTTPSPADANAEAAKTEEPKSWDQQYIRKWRDSYTLASFYKTNDGGSRVSPFPQTDHEKRRREKDIKEICEAGRKLGMKDAAIQANIANMEMLLPELRPNLHKMKASEWAKLSVDVNQVVQKLIAIKNIYPTADIAKIVGANPKVLFKPNEQLQTEGAQVHAMLSKASNVDAIVEAVPDLMNPAALANSLGNLQTWFPDQDPVEVLQKNPKLLLNIGEADLEADPVYGEITFAG